jgi:hypothetical protein
MQFHDWCNLSDPLFKPSQVKGVGCFFQFIQRDLELELGFTFPDWILNNDVMYLQYPSYVQEELKSYII